MVSEQVQLAIVTGLVTVLLALISGLRVRHLSAPRPLSLSARDQLPQLGDQDGEVLDHVG